MARFFEPDMGSDPSNPLARDGDGKLEMIASWLAMWPEAGSPNRALSYDEINSVKAWLSRVEHVQHSRNLFRFVYDEPVTMTPPLLKTHAVNEPIGLGPKVGLPKIELPVLTGFLWARPEQQPEPHKRVAAQLRYQGKGTLVHRGDRVGEFLVHRIDAPDTVTLVNVGTGSEVVLYLE